MKAQTLLVVAFCVAFTVAFTAAFGTGKKGCGCGTKDQLISLNESRPQRNVAQLLARC
jgi:hypothetical protein